jgi:hypothetical protein
MYEGGAVVVNAEGLAFMRVEIPYIDLGVILKCTSTDNSSSTANHNFEHAGRKLKTCLVLTAEVRDVANVECSRVDHNLVGHSDSHNFLSGLPMRLPRSTSV